MNNISQKNWFIWIASLFPGLGIIMLGKRKMGVGVTLGVGLLFAIFWSAPNLITWFIAGIAFIAQMAYAVGLATIRDTKSEVTPNSNLARPLPTRFSDKKQMAVEVKQSLSTVLGNSEQLTTAIVGLKQDSSQFIYVGVTQEHLILSHCSQAGNPSNPQRLLKNDVSWVSLKIGERNLLVSIEYGSGEKITLHVLGILREQAKLIVNEFPGTWSHENFLDGFSSLQKENYRFGAYIVAIGCFAIFIAGVILTNGLEQPYKNMAFYLIASLTFFNTGWPQFISFVRRLKKEPGITSINVFASILMLSVLFLWSVTLYMSGVITIAVIKYLHIVG